MLSNFYKISFFFTGPQPIVEYRRSDEGIGLDNYKVTYNPVPAAVSDATSTDHLTEGAVRVKDNEVDAVQDTLQQAFLKTGKY